MARRRIKLTLEYDGRPFAGWQRQKGEPSVQEALQAALETALGHPVDVCGAGRTDAGVHALGMVAHFDTENPIPIERLPRALRGPLRPEISVLAAEEVSPRFDARRDALLRWYRYQLDLSGERHPLGPRVWRIGLAISPERLQTALACFVGEHEFGGFRGAGCDAERTRLTMREASIARSGPWVALDFKCRSFLHKMVRLMVGAAVQAAARRIEIDTIQRVLATAERPATLLAAPPEGLCLMAVAYSEAEVQKVLTARPSPPSF